jgi:hypothetical protein
MKKEMAKNLFIHTSDDTDSEKFIHIKVTSGDSLDDVIKKLAKRLKRKTHQEIQLYDTGSLIADDTNLADLFGEANSKRLTYSIKETNQKLDKFLHPNPINKSTGQSRKTSSASQSRLEEPLEEGEDIDQLLGDRESRESRHGRKRKYSHNQSTHSSENFMGKKQRHKSETNIDAHKVFKKRKYSDDDIRQPGTKFQRLDFEEGEIHDYYDNSELTTPINRKEYTATEVCKKREEYGNFNDILKDTGTTKFSELSKMFEKIRLNEDRKLTVKKRLGERIPKLKNSKSIENKKGYINFFLNTVNLHQIRTKRQCDFKLNLILDIDSTILHSETIDLNSDLETNRQEEIFVINPRKECKLRFKVRKSFLEFLKRISELCNVYISTHAQEFYALDVVRIINEETGISIKDDQVHSVKTQMTAIQQKTLR